MKKPVRVWSADRSKRHGIVVGSYEELLEKSASKLSIPFSEKLKVVLEEDGTSVDEAYYELLKDHTRLLILLPEETWEPPCNWPPKKGDIHIDMVDGSDEEKALAEKLFVELQHNPAIMVFLNLSDMEIIKDTNVDELESKFVNKECAKQLQEQCINLYIRKKKEEAACELIDLIKQKAMENKC